MKNKLSRWLSPGIGIKRWLTLLGLSGLLCGTMTGIFLSQPQCLCSPIILLLVASFTLFFFAFYRVLQFVEKISVIASRGELGKWFSHLPKTNKSPKIVAIGGGTGLSTLLRGFRSYGNQRQEKNLCAIVTVTDDGGSSGKLRQELGILPPGDIRNCIAAMSREEPLMQRLFQYRFPEESSITGHSFGNLFIAAMADLTGSFDKGVEQACHLLDISGKVLPSTLENVTLQAKLEDGTIVEGESQIGSLPRPHGRITSITMIPADAKPLTEAIDAINSADAIILGPGSLYTSIIPNLLIRDLRDAIIASPAIRILIVNVMTQHNETDGYSAADHLETLKEYLGIYPDIIIANDSKMPTDLLEKYAVEKAVPVKIDKDRLDKLPVELHLSDFLYQEDYLRHDPIKLADYLVHFISERSKS